MSETTTVMTRDQVSAAIAQKAWKDEAFHRKVLANPNKMYEEHFGKPLPEGVNLKVLEDTPTTIHFVLPSRPADAGELSDDELEKVAGGTFALAMSLAASAMFTLAIGGGMAVEANKTANFW